MPLKQKVRGQRHANLVAEGFAKTEGKLRDYCRWAIAKLKVERAIGQDFEAMGLRRGGSKARGAPLKRALEELHLHKKTADRWRKVARIPQDWFDRYLEEHVAEATALSTDAILFAWESEQPGHLNIQGARGPGEGYPSDLILVTDDPTGTPFDELDTAVKVSMDVRDVTRAIRTWTDAWEIASFDRAFLTKMQDLRRAFKAKGMTDAVVELVNRAHASWC